MKDEDQKWMTVTQVAEIAPGDMKPARVGQREIALYNVDGELHATDNLCTHAHAYLTDGWLDGDIVECPVHGGRFNVKSGAGMGAPISCDLKVHCVRVVGADVQIKLG
jgi:nitrite reductase/ring-hydroxylating ferredoxin subunit